MSDQLNDKVIEIALRNLRVTGCKYIVIKPDGSQVVEGELALAAVKGTRKGYKKVHDFRLTGYRDIVAAMEPGDKYRFECNGQYPPTSFQKVISARASHCFGSGNFHTMQSGDGIDLIRLA